SWFIGKPINSYFDYVFDGIYQEGDDDIPAGSQPGFVRVRDLDGDGKISPEDRTVVGSGGTPDYQFSLRITSPTAILHFPYSSTLCRDGHHLLILLIHLFQAEA